MCRFKRLVRLLSFVAIAVLNSVTPVTAKDVFSFGVVPQFEIRTLSDIWIPILDELEERTGYKFDFSVSPRIPDFEQSFINGEFDFAYMNPYHLIMANSAQGYTPLVNDPNRKLFGILVVRKDSPLLSPQELEDATIAFPAPNALGASLMMRADLDMDFQVNFKPFYLSTHASAYLNVIVGDAAAAGGVMGTFRAQPQEIRDSLRIIHETRKVPAHPVAAHPRVPQNVKEKVRQAFIDMAATPDGAELLSKVPMSGAAPVPMENFEILKNMNLENYVANIGE